MNPADGLLDELASAGVRLRVEDGRIRFRAPAGVMTEERKRAIKAREAEIIALIEERRADRGETISRIPEAERYEPSPGQRRLWILEKLEGASAAYNVPLLHWLDGPLDVDTLRAAFERIMARHESLRTVIVSDAGVPFQRVASAIALPFEFHDHGHAADPESAAIAAARSFIVRPFDLGRGPLSGIALHRIASERHLLAVSFHHAVADGVSIAVLGREIGEFYAAIRTGRTPRLPELRLQYRDYAAWRNRMIEAPEGFASARRYWIERLAPPIPTLDLPADFPRPAVQGFAGAEETFVLDAATSAAFKDLCRRRGATLFMGLVAAVKALLHRYTGAPEIIVGTPVAGRDHVDLEPLIGLFINTLVLRDTVDGETPFADLLASVARNAGEAFDHADYPFDLLVSDLALDRDLGRSPIFDVMIILQNQQPGDSGLAIEGIAATPVYGHTGTSKFDLTFNFHEFAEGITAAIEYRTDLFRAARIRRMGDHLAAFVRGVIAAPETPIGRIEMRSGEERALIETRGTRCGGYRLDRTPIELFAAQAAARPDAVAVEDGNGKLSYRELDRLSDRVASSLVAAGIGPGATVAIRVERSARMLAALLGIWKAGAAYLPLDPGFPEERLEFMLRDAGAEALIADGDANCVGAGLRPAPTDIADGTPVFRPASCCAPAVITLEDACAFEEIRSFAPVKLDDLAYIIYTSGSTGTPKGVEVSQRNLANFLLAMVESPGLRVDDRLLAVTTISFDIAGLELFLPLVVGATVIIASRHEAGDPMLLASLLGEKKASVMQATPATWKMLFAANWRPPARFKALVGGEAVTGRLAAELLRRDCEVWNMYGPTETTIWSTTLKVEGDPGDWESMPVIPIGRPIGNTIIRVLDANAADQPAGLPGDLFIGGDGVARGYRGRPELTAERFVSLSANSDIAGPLSDRPRFGFATATRLYRTGDRAMWDENGVLHFLGRDDHQVKIRGFRIEVGEVETALAKIAGVREAVVVALDDAVGEKTLAAYLVPRDSVARAALDPALLRAELDRRLPDYMIPSLFVILTALPLTPNGKIDRRALPRPDRDSLVGTAGEAAAVEPRDERERTIRDIFARVLDLELVGIHDDFFVLGGHSLRATRAAYLAEEALGVEVGLADIFHAPTVAALAERLADRAAPADAIAPIVEEIAAASADELALLDDEDDRP